MILPAPWHREYDMDKTVYATHGSSGTGSASTIEMTDEEMEAVVKRPVGFVWPEDGR